MYLNVVWDPPTKTINICEFDHNHLPSQTEVLLDDSSSACLWHHWLVLLEGVSRIFFSLSHLLLTHDNADWFELPKLHSSQNVLECSPYENLDMKL